MPEDRRRYPAPDPSKFANPRAEKMYWATERLLDESPGFGGLEMRYLYDSWHSLRQEFLQQGETDEETRQIAWGVLAFFVATRLAEMGQEVATNEQLRENFPVSELDMLQAWVKMQYSHYDEETESYRGEPFFSATYEIVQEIKLSDCLPTQIVDPQNPDSPSFGHLQLLDRAADRQPISEELKNSVLAVTTSNKDFLEHQIDSWNEILDTELPDKVEEADRTHLLDTTYAGLVFTMVFSWGDEETAFRRFELLDICLSRLRQKQNPFQDFFSLEGVDKRLKQWRMSRGGPEAAEIGEYQVPESALQEIKFPFAPQLRSINESSFFNVELEGYKGLNFGLVFNWVPQSQKWIGHAIISHAGKEPPRSSTWPVWLLGVNTPTEAAAGLIHYYQENLEALVPPRRVALTQEEKSEVLESLRQMSIRRIGPVDSETQKRALGLMELLMGEVADFQKFPPVFTLAVRDLETQEIYWGISVIQGDSIGLVSEIGATIADDFIELIDTVIEKKVKHQKAIVCSESLLQLILKDPETKVRSRSRGKTIIKRPRGHITIYHGGILQ